jgi:hypothetical protein
MKHFFESIKSDNILLKKPFIRIIAVSICIFSIYIFLLSLNNVVNMWKYDILGAWSKTVWTVFLGCQVFIIFIVYISLKATLSGTVPFLKRKSR